MRVLVTGGAGYIGSHTVLALLAAGHQVWVVDSFVNSSPLVIGRLEELSDQKIPLIELDLTDYAATN
ncbi:MAG: SDR family NAD(P)-dependent oxidoreductase, partial [Promicromonosporaceae bacterium]|nr:SDR family NAD(P)-dependent oxidoreductase [Promicromonosporaceae bacterium]